MGDQAIKGSQCLVKRLLWSWLVILFLAHAVQANSLTKLQVVDSSATSQVLLLTAHPPSYQVIPLLEQNLLVIHLADTTASRHYPLPRFTGPLIQGIRITEGSPSPSLSPLGSGDDPPGRPHSGGVRVEVVLKTAEVSFIHKSLGKSPGMILIVRKGKSSTRAGRREQGRGVRGQGAAVADSERKAPPSEPRSPSPAPIAPTPLVGATDMAPLDDPIRIPTVEQLPVAERPEWRTKGDAAVQQEPPQEPSLLTMEHLKGLMGGGAAGESLTLLELYLNHRTVFLTNPSLLWQVAATYADLALYDEAVALYTRILERADDPVLQAAALLKQGKIAFLQDDWATAETLLQQFIKAPQHGSFLGEAYEALGDVVAAQGKFGEAVGAYMVALSHTPEAHKTAQMFYKVGRAQKRAGNWPKAAEVFQKAIERLPGQTPPDPLEVAALQQLGESLYNTHQFQGAVAVYRRVLERSPGDWQTAWTRYYLGKSYEKLGRNNEALQAYQELAQQADPLWAEMGKQGLADMRWRGRYLPN